MKTKLMLSMSLLIAMMAMAGTAQALTWSIHGPTSCLAADGDDQDNINYNTISLDWEVVEPVLCSLDRITQNTNGALIFVEVRSEGNDINCTAYSYEWDGTLLDSVSGSFTGTGSNYITLDLRGSGSSSPWSHYNVSCTPAGAVNVFIRNIALGE
ncbi:MAG: hypothetical protein ACU84H_00790 [Gammaproteobacteria bacterium]